MRPLSVRGKAGRDASYTILRPGAGKAPGGHNCAASLEPPPQRRHICVRMTLPDPDRLVNMAAAARACTRCTDLPLGPRPVLRVCATARLLIVGQAPGIRVHETGVPWNDASGDRLRLWLGMSRDEFYDGSRIAVIPTGLCYPGRLPRGGDAPPRAGCAAQWHPRLLPLLSGLRLTLLVGSHAQAFTLGPGNMTARVRDFRRFLPAQFPLPHPSWRTLGWERRNPWFAAEVLPELRAAAAAALAPPVTAATDAAATPRCRETASAR